VTSGYELPQAVADLVDDSIAAFATQVSIDLHFAGDKSWIHRVHDRASDPQKLAPGLGIRENK
jgi:hypothetical protein